MTQISPNKKNQFLFTLCRLKKDCHYPPICVDFTPLQRPNLTFQSISPTFNRDQNYFTPAFINPYQRSLIKFAPSTTQNNEKEKFFKKIEANLSKASEEEPFFNPKDDLFCSICRTSFSDYWKHIGSSHHNRKIKGSIGEKYIQELCESFNECEKKEDSESQMKNYEIPKKTKKIKKQENDKKCSTKNKKRRNQDLIIKLPKDIFQRYDRALNYNLSTNGVTSQDVKQ